MSTLSQVGRGAVLLTSMALVACYIDVYTTGKFPWQHAAAEETPATIPPPEFISDPAVQQTQFVQAPATQEQRMFMAGSKSDVAASAIVMQPPAANGQTATPIFMSGSKSYGGATGLLPGALNPPANPQADQKTEGNGQQNVLPATNEPGFFFTNGKSPLGMSGRITETMPSSSPPPAPNTAPTVSKDKMQFMSGSKSIGPAALPTATIPAPLQINPVNQAYGYPTTTTQQTTPTGTDSPTANANLNPLFMSGAKSPIRDVPKQSLFDNPIPAPSKPGTQANAPNSAPKFMGGAKSPFGAPPQMAPNAPPPMQQQVTPSKILPRNAPFSPAGSY